MPPAPPQWWQGANPQPWQNQAGPNWWNRGPVGAYQPPPAVPPTPTAPPVATAPTMGLGSGMRPMSFGGGPDAADRKGALGPNAYNDQFPGTLGEFLAGPMARLATVGMGSPLGIGGMMAGLTSRNPARSGMYGFAPAMARGIDSVFGTGGGRTWSAPQVNRAQYGVDSFATADDPSRRARARSGLGAKEQDSRDNGRDFGGGRGGRAGGGRGRDAAGGMAGVGTGGFY